jgi:hypothetical protein
MKVRTPLRIRRFNQKALRDAVEPEVQRLQQRVDEVCGRVLRAGADRPVEDIKTMLAQEWLTAFGRELTDPDLSRIAAALAAGTPR